MESKVSLNVGSSPTWCANKIYSNREKCAFYIYLKISIKMWTNEEVNILLVGYKYGIDECIRLIPGKSREEIISKLNLLGYSFDEYDKYSFDNLYKIVGESHSINECLDRLNISKNGSSCRVKLLSKIDEFEIDTNHFTQSTSRSTPITTTFEDSFTVKSKSNRKAIKKFIYKHSLMDIECSECGQGEEWRGNKMSLILDHINGINDDNRIENLRLLCPNCNATTDTFAGKNVRNKK